MEQTSSRVNVVFMEIDPRRLLVLLAVHRAGGIVAAADLSGQTASAISQQIARLESEIGAAVLDRQPTGAVLTPAGRVLADAAERMETELTDARRSLAALQEDITGTVYIGAFQTALRTLLVPLMEQVAGSLPGLELVVVETVGDNGQQALRSGQIDILLLEADSPVGQSSPRGTRDVSILDEPWLVVLPAASATPATLADLEQLTWLGVDPDAAAHRATQRVQSGFGQPARIAHRYSDYDVALSMVSAGLGVALLPQLAVQGGYPEATQVVSVPGTGTRRLVARHRATRFEPRQQVRAVLDEIIRVAGEFEPTV